MNSVGINLDGLGWTPSQPPTAEITRYYLDKGFRLFRIPLPWEMIQPTLYGPLDQAVMIAFDRMVVQILARPDTKVIIDLHNYMRRPVQTGPIIGQSAEVTAGHFVDLWVRLVRRYGTNPGIWYGLMNEPHDVDSPTLAATLNSCIVAMRAAGAKGAIVVPGNDWCNGERWIRSGNDKLADAIATDPGIVFDVHQYLDAWGNGQTGTAEPRSGQRLDEVTAWAERTGRMLLLGETGTTGDAASMAEMGRLLKTVRNSPNWVGFCWWSSLGGHADPNRRWYNLDPLNGRDMPQMTLVTAR